MKKDHYHQRKTWVRITNVFIAVVNEILGSLPIIGEPVSEFSYFVPEPRKFAEVTRLSEVMRKLWLKANLK